MNKLLQNLAFTLMHERESLFSYIRVSQCSFIDCLAFNIVVLIIGFLMKSQAIGLNGLLANLMLPAKENEAAAVFLMSKV